MRITNSADGERGAPCLPRTTEDFQDEQFSFPLCGKFLARDKEESSELASISAST
jgi:hypothetical protein